MYIMVVCIDIHVFKMLCYVNLLCVFKMITSAAVTINALEIHTDNAIYTRVI